MNFMSVDTVFMYWGSRWIILFLVVGTSMDFLFFVVRYLSPGMEAVAGGRGIQKMTQKTQILGVISDFPSIDRAALEHRQNDRNNGQ